MALYMIERNFAEALGVIEPEEPGGIQQSVRDELGLEWVQSFLTADRTRTYCLYEAPDPEALMEHARRLGLPADAIVEVSTLK